MPLATVYTSEKKANELNRILPKLRSVIAQQLSCAERTIKSEEVSIQVLLPFSRLPIADTEIMISAYSFNERVKKQDKICLEIKEFLLGNGFDSVFVWLQLSELGHSAG